jgi:GxxExxY protein
VGEFMADLLVENRVLVELKAVKELDNIHMAQCMNYLKATDMKICLLFNFGKPKIQYKRIVYSL